MSFRYTNAREKLKNPPPFDKYGIPDDFTDFAHFFNGIVKFNVDLYIETAINKFGAKETDEMLQMEAIAKLVLYNAAVGYEISGNKYKQQLKDTIEALIAQRKKGSKSWNNRWGWDPAKQVLEQEDEEEAPRRESVRGKPTQRESKRGSEHSQVKAEQQSTAPTSKPKNQDKSKRSASTSADSRPKRGVMLTAEPTPADPVPSAPEHAPFIPLSRERMESADADRRRSLTTEPDAPTAEHTSDIMTDIFENIKKEADNFVAKIDPSYQSVFDKETGIFSIVDPHKKDESSKVVDIFVNDKGNLSLTANPKHEKAIEALVKAALETAKQELALEVEKQLRKSEPGYAQVMQGKFAEEDKKDAYERMSKKRDALAKALMADPENTIFSYDITKGSPEKIADLIKGMNETKPRLRAVLADTLIDKIDKALEQPSKLPEDKQEILKQALEAQLSPDKYEELEKHWKSSSRPQN